MNLKIIMIAYMKKVSGKKLAIHNSVTQLMIQNMSETYTDG